MTHYDTYFITCLQFHQISYDKTFLMQLSFTFILKKYVLTCLFAINVNFV